MLLYALLTRTREIGIRMALGAEPARASFAIMKSGLQFVAAGLLLGALCAVPAGIIAGRNFTGSDVSDPVPYIAALAGVMIATIAAAYVPARRAANVEPMTALRYE
jgi:ABC-type antimicrobial peptide transport system permease subunit